MLRPGPGARERWGTVRRAPAVEAHATLRSVRREGQTDRINSWPTANEGWREDQVVWNACTQLVRHVARQLLLHLLRQKAKRLLNRQSASTQYRVHPVCGLGSQSGRPKSGVSEHRDAVVRL